MGMRYNYRTFYYTVALKMYEFNICFFVNLALDYDVEGHFIDDKRPELPATSNESSDSIHVLIIKNAL